MADRNPAGISLIAVSKTHAADAIRSAMAAGQHVFGENRVQEAQSKFPELRKFCTTLELHLIGPLQSNKARDAVELFDVIHTLDRASLAEALRREVDRAGRCPRLFIQVNTGEEDQKAGVAPHEALSFVERCRTEWKLQIDGLMCIPPVEDQPAPHFALLARLARQAGLNELSMGMSGDFEAAIALGATCVRVGSAIFGERPQSG
jgi:pyridoxal phosphate enzyme (YggS family)